jgi:hypothetical protein
MMEGLALMKILVFTRTPDGWKIAHLHASTMPLPSQSQQTR